MAHNQICFGNRFSDLSEAYYAHSLAVYFAPFDEDYGYITLEAWLSSKPVITATDSGGPAELITHEQDGWIVEPNAQAVAQVLHSDAARNPFLASLSFAFIVLTWHNAAPRAAL